MDSAKSYGSGFVSYLIGPGFIPQIVLTIVFFIGLQIILSIIQSMVDTVKNLSKQVVVLQSDTVTGSYTVAQDPRLPKQIFNSNNELNGTEFSYSMFVFVTPETFDTHTESLGTECTSNRSEETTKLRHVFSKGSKALFPLMAPGIFMEGNINTMRIYMNSSLNWNNYVSVPNIPISKWFHLVVMMKGRFMDVYINGNVAARQQFQTVPKLNVGNVYIMSNRKFQSKAGENSTDDFIVSGSMKGMVSVATYYSYALTYSQIDDIYRRGPSKVLVNPSQQQMDFLIPPYLHDDWWVTQY